MSHLGVLGITRLGADRANVATIATAVRGEWGIEVLHWRRDVMFAEDASRVRTRSGPRVMASLRNLATGALHLAGRDDTTAATRSDDSRSPRSSPDVALNTALASGSIAGSWKAPSAQYWFCRLGIRWEIRDEIRQALITLGCAIMTGGRRAATCSGHPTVMSAGWEP